MFWNEIEEITPRVIHFTYVKIWSIKWILNRIDFFSEIVERKVVFDETNATKKTKRKRATKEQFV